MEDHLLAGGALVPEIVRHLAPREQRADLRADEFGEPAHAGILMPGLGAAHALGQRAHLVQHLAHRVGLGLAGVVQVGRQRVDQRGGDHRRIGDRATPPPPAAGVRTPKPMAIGRSVTLADARDRLRQMLGASGCACR